MESKFPNGSEQGTPQMDKGSQDLEDQTGLNFKNGQTGKPITRIRNSHNDLTVMIQNSNLDYVKCSESSKSDLATVFCVLNIILRIRNCQHQELTEYYKATRCSSQ